MPRIDLDAVQSALVKTSIDVERRIDADRNRFQRYANKKLQRLHRETQNNSTRTMQAIAESTGAKIPSDAFLGVAPDGRAFVEWRDPIPAKPPTPPDPPKVDQIHEAQRPIRILEKDDVEEEATA